MEGATSEQQRTPAHGSATTLDSPLSSPEIEITEPEDMRNEAMDSIQLIDDEEDDSSVRSLIGDFPYADRRTPVEAVQLMLDHFAKAEPIMHDVLRLLSQWLAQHLTTIEHLATERHRINPEYRELVGDLAAAVWHLVGRRYDLGLDLSLSTLSSLFHQLFSNYVRLCSQLLDVDIATLRSARTDRPFPASDLLSPRHVRVVEVLFRPYITVPIWNTLRNHYGMSVEGMHGNLIQIFAGAPEKGVQRLAEMSELLIAKCEPSRLWEVLSDFVRLVGCLAIRCRVLYASICNGRREIPPPSAWASFPKDSFGFFEAINGKLQATLETQTSSLPTDFCELAVSELGNLVYAIATMNIELVDNLRQSLLGNFVVAPEDVDDVPILLSFAWRFKILLSFIRKGSLMLRIKGVDTMNDQLVQVYKKYVDHQTGRERLVPRFLAAFLLEEKVTNYLVGVDSHSQLITRSGNIVGFLAVTQRYSEKETDIIWNTVAKSPDPEIVTAALTMLEKIFELLSCQDLLYLCTKVNEMPLSAFNLDMQTFTFSLFNAIRRKPQILHHTLPIEPYRICVRLLQEILAGPTMNSDGRSLLGLIHKELSQITQLGISDSDRYKIYEDCAEQIHERTPYAAGSAQAVLHCLEAWDSPTDQEFLFEKLDMMRLLTEEYCLFVDHHRAGERSLSLPGTLRPRLDGLLRLLFEKQKSVPPEIENALWQRLVGRYSLNSDAREMAWSLLATYMEEHVLRQGGVHELIDRCLNVHLRDTDPMLFTLGVRAFLEAGIRYSIQVRPAVAKSEIPLLRQQWHIIMTAPDDIAKVLITGLIDCYIGTDCPWNADASVAEAAHVALVKQCLDPSNLTGSDLEPVRKLQILHELSTRVKPLHNVDQVLGRSGSPSFELANGNPVQIPLQVHDGGQQSRCIIVQVGDLVTAGELSKHIAKLTDFVDYQVYAHGQLLDMQQLSNKTIRASGIGNKGASARVGRPAVEREILEHADMLYEFLDADDALSDVAFRLLHNMPTLAPAQRLVDRESMSTTDLLPKGKFYKTLYMLDVLQRSLDEQLQRAVADEALILQGVQLLVQALMDGNSTKEILNPASKQRYAFPNLLPLSEQSFGGTPANAKLKVLRTDMNSSLSHERGLQVTKKTLECLLKFLRERPNTDVSASYFANPTGLVDTLLSILSAIAQSRSQDVVVVGRDTYCVILEASRLNRSVWEAFVSRADVVEMHRMLLLHADAGLQSAVAACVQRLCEDRQLNVLSQEEVASFYWKILLAVLPSIFERPQCSEPLLSIAPEIVIIRSTSGSFEEDIEMAFKTWSSGLLEHQFDVVRRFSSDLGVVADYFQFGADSIIVGLAKLLRTCLRCMKSEYKRLPRTGTCLEEVPDHLVLNLKRFDFDMTQNIRFKINDTFEFPRKIDMSAYRIEQFFEPKVPTPEDCFELVGVLVHLGSAENGHYYSFIRQRPYLEGEEDKWINFNDDRAETFDPKRLAKECFGGSFSKGTAYMLFYQRSSTINNSDGVLFDPVFGTPPKVALPAPLESQIMQSNEQLLRKDFLRQPNHAQFVRKLLAKYTYVSKGVCSEDLQIEKQVMYLALQQLDVATSFLEDEFEGTMKALKNLMVAQPKCLRLYVEWIGENQWTVCNLLLRCASWKVRDGFAAFTSWSVERLKDNGEPNFYGNNVSEVSEDGTLGLDQPNSAYLVVLNSLHACWMRLCDNGMGWDSYFGLLCSLAGPKFQPEATGLFLVWEFLADCLELLTIDSGADSRRNHKLVWRAMRSKTMMKFQHNRLIEFVYILLQHVDLGSPPLDSHAEREQYSATEKLPLLVFERERLFIWDEDPSIEHWAVPLLEYKKSESVRNEALTLVKDLFSSSRYASDPETLQIRAWAARSLASAIIKGFRNVTRSNSEALIYAMLECQSLLVSIVEATGPEAEGLRATQDQAIIARCRQSFEDSTTKDDFFAETSDEYETDGPWEDDLDAADE
ncbi:hypothetical protein LTR39_000648 [Cryomyces antarcticus]|nr:hypothetical protein LTR39_000648 [Cryomyces antarcticus]